MTSADVDDADRDSLAACATGSEAALEDLYQRHAAVCFGLALSILRDHRDAQDTVQAVYLDLWRQAARLDIGRTSLRSQLLLMTRSRAIDRVRGTGRRTALPLLPPDGDRADHRPGPAAQAVLGELSTDVQDMLATLSPQGREVLALAFWGGYTQRQIADLTQTSLDAIRTRAQQALADLRAGLDATARDAAALVPPDGSTDTTREASLSRSSDPSAMS